MIFIFKSLTSHGLVETSELVAVEMNFAPCPVFNFRGEEIVPHPENPSYVRGSLSDVIIKLRSSGYDRIEEVKIVVQLSELNEHYFKTIIEELYEHGFEVSVSSF
ncbi:hypothetical protein [Clostridium cylindrosporum]|uniref:Uncharacterized protein n=1 Tax=Clostridium cylindrosporum DSM 605 TaxID=1121307 RepID=A0A0J8D8C7_CLOCY|nr:hypothetical protein [Clostridium cylindrosporum]KMT22310.1 hypothetical protein CLCY_17c00040 [Clostridium cylindrosporum DSM 605]